MNILCAICFDNLFASEEEESIYSTNCGHVFHYNCLLQWMESSSTCPNCRQNIKIDNLLKLSVSWNTEESLSSKNKTITRCVRESNQQSNFLQSELELKNSELKLKVKELSLKNIQLQRLEKNQTEVEKENDTLRFKINNLQKEVEKLKNLLQSERERNTIIRSDLRIMDIIDLDQERNANGSESIDLTS